MTKISQLTNIGSALAADDEFVVRDVSDISTPNKKVTSSGIIDYIIAQGGVSGFTQIAAGAGPLSRVQATSSGATGTITLSTASATTLLERVRIDSAGRVLVGTSTANTSGAKLQTSDGLTFPATQVASADPNTLDDYEEGLWTPTCVGSSTAGTYTVSITSATYTKVGNQVTVWASFGFSVATGGTGSVRLSGLPFNYKANPAIAGIVQLANVNTTSASSNGVCISNVTNSSAATFYPGLNIDNAGIEEIPISGISTSSTFIINFTYQVP